MLFSTLGFVLSSPSMFSSVIHIKKNSQTVVSSLFVGKQCQVNCMAAAQVLKCLVGIPCIEELLATLVLAWN